MARRFAFRLQTLLRVRELREREAERRVGRKRAEIAQLDEWNRATGAEIETHQEALRAAQQAALLAPPELARTRSWIAHLRQTIAARTVVKERLRGELAQLLSDWRNTRRDKRIIEKLRERRWTEYLQARAAEEQSAADELAQQMHAGRPADWAE